MVTAENLEDIIIEIRFHAECLQNSLEHLDILKGYDQARMRLGHIIRALDRTDVGIIPWVTIAQKE